MIFRFGEFELDVAGAELRRQGRPVPIQPKPLALLTLLVEERHRVVPTDELLERLWPDEVVTSSSLTRAVSVARRAIDDPGRDGRIRSHTRLGYRFHGSVLASEGEPGPETEDAVGATGEDDVPFVGREAALARLRAAFRRAAEGSGRILLLAGPAGIGKSRLAERFGREVERRGGLVLSGRALEEEGEPAFWVWAQVLRGLREADPTSLDVPGLADSGELAALMPELGTPEKGVAAHLPADQRRFVFFDAVARALARAADERPILVVFEDVHWADPASQRLLEHLAFELARAPVLLLVTVRDQRSGRDEATARTLSALQRQAGFEALTLDGLAATELEELVEKWAGVALPDVARRLHARTEGVPLFVREAIRRLDEAGARQDPAKLAGELPAARIDWVADSLAKLSEACTALVGAAAVLGRQFSLRVLAEAGEVSREEALDLMDEAVAAGVIEPEPRAPARYRFVHNLFRETAYDGLAPGVRVRLHDRIADQLARRHTDSLDEVASELAHHRYRALAVGDPDEAFACAARAAECAFDARAYEQAARHWRQALAALDHLEVADPPRRLRSLLGLGEASRLAGEREQRREHFGEALVLARARGRPEDVAAAAVGLCDIAEWGVRDDEGRAALGEALAGLESSEDELEARILTRLGYLDSLLNRELAEDHLRRAVQIARGIGAADALEEALYALHLALGGPDGKDERLEILEELRGAASAARDPVASVIAVLDVACDRLELGDVEGAARLRRESDTTAGEPAHPRTRWHQLVYDTGLALMQGRLGEVEGRARVARELGQRIQHPYARGCYTAHLSGLHDVRGEAGPLLAQLEPTLAARQGPTHWVRARVARARAALGRRDEARDAFQEVLDQGIEAIPRNLRWLATLTELAHCAADLDDAAAAELLLEALDPFEAHHSVLPMVISYGGPVSFALARLQEVRAHADEAHALYAHALHAARGLGARPSQVHVHLVHGRFLRRRGRRSAAREHFRSAAALAAELDMPELERRAREEPEG